MLPRWWLRQANLSALHRPLTKPKCSVDIRRPTLHSPTRSAQSLQQSLRVEGRSSVCGWAYAGPGSSDMGRICTLHPRVGTTSSWDGSSVTWYRTAPATNKRRWGRTAAKRGKRERTVLAAKVFNWPHRFSGLQFWWASSLKCESAVATQLNRQQQPVDCPRNPVHLEMQVFFHWDFARALTNECTFAFSRSLSTLLFNHTDRSCLATTFP